MTKDCCASKFQASKQGIFVLRFTFYLATIGRWRSCALIHLVLLLYELMTADEVALLWTKCTIVRLEAVIVICLDLLL
jgi:hypothetical protein